MKLPKPFVTKLTIIIVFVGVVTVRHQRHEAWLNERVPEETTIACHFTTSKEEERLKAITAQSNWELNKLGGASLSANLLEAVRPYLNSPAPDIRSRALNMLGRTEDPSALALIEPLLTDPQCAHSASFAKWRIENRDLHDEAKINAFARWIGLSWSDLVELSQKVVDTRNGYSGWRRGDEDMEDTAEVLCGMARRGEEVDSWITPPSETKNFWDRFKLNHRIVLDKNQIAKIHAAGLGEENEIRYLLDYMSKLRVLRVEEYRFADYIVGLGDKVPPLLIQKLEEIERNPTANYGLEPIPGKSGSYYPKMGCKYTLFVCKSTNDASVMAKLSQMGQSRLPVPIKSGAWQTMLDMVSLQNQVNEMLKS